MLERTAGAGANDEVNNYVCIKNEDVCSDANLFRIIGVFNNQVKLIRAKSDSNFLLGFMLISMESI